MRSLLRTRCLKDQSLLFESSRYEFIARFAVMSGSLMGFNAFAVPLAVPRAVIYGKGVN